MIETRFGSILAVLVASLLLSDCGAGNDPPFNQDATGSDTTGSDTIHDVAADDSTTPADVVHEYGDPGWEEVCGEEDLPLEYEVNSDVLIVLDRSGSMMLMLNNLKTAVNTVASASEEKIWFGLMPFPNSVPPGDCALIRPLTECNAPTTPAVMLGPLKAADIASTLVGLTICGSTPTSQTLVNAHAYLSSTSTGHSQYVLLATDGVPNCNSSLDPSTCECLDTDTGCVGRPEACLDDAATYAALDALLADGIPTYVLGMGAWLGTDREIMNNMAEHGGTTSFYPAETPAGLLSAFEAIMGTVVVSCRFDIHPGEEVDPTKVNFYIDGEIVPRDTSHAAGWDYVDEDTIEFYGVWCDRIMSGGISGVTATFGCPTLLI
ncbi:MAG: VWA domain-containing protein [Deltaproteobacteria bacterium]|nr:VWA domain-containing protein [Deltaproteobacteria bacterium]